MTVEAVHVEAVEPYADRRYECVRGTVAFAVDPVAPAWRRRCRC